MYICIYRWVCTTCARRRISASSRGNIFSKVLYILTVSSEYTKAPTVENFFSSTVLYIVTFKSPLYCHFLSSEYTKALTFENLRQCCCEK